VKLNRNVMSLVVVCMLAIFASAGYADHGVGCNRGDGPGEHKKRDFSAKVMKRMHIVLKNKKDLELTDEQVQAIRKLKSDIKKKVITMKAEVDIIVVDIKAMMYDDPMDTEAVNALIDKKYEIKKKQAKVLIGVCAEVKKILNEEQKDKLCDLFSDQGCKK